MEIQFKEYEITEALRQYVARRFNIAGQTFSADFRMGKGKNGLSVLVSIEDETIPVNNSTSSVSEPTVQATPAANTVGAVITETAKEVVATTAKADELVAPAMIANPQKGKGIEAAEEESAPATVTEPDTSESTEDSIFG